MIKARVGPDRIRMDDHLGTAVDAGLGLNINTACIGKWRVPKSLVRLRFRFILELISSEGYMLDTSLHLLGIRSISNFLYMNALNCEIIQLQSDCGS